MFPIWCGVSPKKQRFTRERSEVIKQSLRFTILVIGLLWLVALRVSANEDGLGTQLTQLKGLTFGSAIAGFRQKLIVNPNADGAAVFEAQGTPQAWVTIYVVEDQILLTTPTNPNNASEIVVKRFKRGGNLRRKWRARFDRSGRVTNLRVGATAVIKAGYESGEYRGQATMRIVYN